MAKSETLFSILLILSLIFTFLFSTLATTEDSKYYKTISPTSLGLRKEKLSHLHFYFHDIVTGPKPTAVRLVEPKTTNNSSTLFGTVVMADDPLTAGPDPSSKLVGKAQGMYASADQNETAFLMVMNLVFTEGKYNGSTLSLLGRNAIFTGIREMPIVGGSGLFRFARGYAHAKTHTHDVKAHNAVVKYNVYVFHY